jgi:hypothetical protein
VRTVGRFDRSAQPAVSADKVGRLENVTARSPLGWRKACAAVPTTFTYSHKVLAACALLPTDTATTDLVPARRCTDERMFARYGSLKDLSSMYDERSQNTSNSSPSRTHSSSLDNVVPCLGNARFQPLSYSISISIS